MITTSFKQSVLEAARKKQEAIVHDFEVRIDDLNGIDYLTDEDQHDLDQQAILQSNKNMIAVLSRELQFAQEELALLNRLVASDTPLPYATIGALVQTDRFLFYPSVSLERFNVDGKEIIGISKHAPLYAQMEGKTVGDTFSYGDMTYTINKIV